MRLFIFLATALLLLLTSIEPLLKPHHNIDHWLWRVEDWTSEHILNHTEQGISSDWFHKLKAHKLFIYKYLKSVLTQWRQTSLLAPEWMYCWSHQPLQSTKSDAIRWRTRWAITLIISFCISTMCVWQSFASVSLLPWNHLHHTISTIEALLGPKADIAE